MLSRAEDLLKRDWEKAEVDSAAFASNFAGKVYAQASRVLEAQQNLWESSSIHRKKEIT